MPNTISDLNDFSNGSLTYEDQRAYSIAFSANATTNQSVSTTEDVAFASPVGIDIVSVISQPGNITYNIDTSNIGSNAIVTWANIPATVSSSSPSTGVYSLTGYWDDVVWNAVKSPQITAKDETSSFVYSANIQYPTVANVANTATWSWTVNVAVSNSHAELSSATNFVYDEDVPMTISGTPTITDAYSGPLSHILTITPNVANAVYSLSVASANVTSNLNPTTKVLTLTGTKANVNTALGNVWLIPGIDYEQNFQLTYQLTNPVSNLQTSVTQQANIGNVEVDFYLQPTHSYDEDGQTQIVFSADDSDTTLVSLTIALTQTSGTNGTMLVNGVNAGIGNTATFTGNRTAFNTANITFYPYSDSTGSVVLSANVSKINGTGNSAVASNVTASLTVGNTHSDYSLTTSYNYSEDSDVAMVWDITDTDIRANSYTSTFTQTSGNSGVFLINGTSQGVGNAAVVTGNLTTVNAANVTFVPYPDYTGNIAIGYDQSKINSLFGNVVQATNVAISANCTSTHSDYSLTNAVSYTEDTSTALTFAILDTDVRATAYTSTFTQTAGNTGVFLVNGVNQGVGNAAVITGNKTTVNAANVIFVPAPDQINAATIGYSQYKQNSLFGNVTQVSNVAISVTGTGNLEPIYSLPSSYTENTLLSFANAIVDTDANAVSYTITVQQNPADSDIGSWYLGNTFQSYANVPYTIAANSKANVNATTLNWLPKWESSANASILYTQVKNNTNFGNVTQASNVAITLSRTATVAGLTNAIARTYGNAQPTQVFTSSTPQINDGSEVGQIYTLTFTANNGANSATFGAFGNSQAVAVNNITGNTPYVVTGNTTFVNSAIANIWYAPVANITIPGNYDIDLVRDSVSSTKTFANTLIGNGNNTFSSVYTFTANTNWTPSSVDLYYAHLFDAMAVGGGGGGHIYGYVQETSPPGSERSGGGGAGGVMRFANAVNMQNIAYTVGIGAGGLPGGQGQGAVGGTGGNTYLANATANIVVATGGQGGSVPQAGYGGNNDDFNGGDRGGGTLSVGPYYGGGGAGAGANGNTASNVLVGVGGIGKISNITGSNVYYGGGGGGGAYWTGNVGNGGLGGGGGTNRSNTSGETGTGGGAASSGTEQGYLAGTGGSGVLIIKVRN